MMDQCLSVLSISEIKKKAFRRSNQRQRCFSVNEKENNHHLCFFLLPFSPQ
ncbi:hypothetical protein Bca4012_061409 [Brassica carinata]